MKNNSEELKNIFQKVGEEFGFDKIDAEFIAFKEFKIRWQRSYKWADFKVSDYLADAPSNVIEDLCRSLFSKIQGVESDETYPKTMCEWVTKTEFTEKYQPVYLKRSRNLSNTTKGKFKDLNEAYQRLVDAGLTSKNPYVYLSWTKEANERKIGHATVLMKVVSISSVLDTDILPEFVLDYCLYHELCHINLGFDPTTSVHKTHFDDLVNKYPKKKEAEEWIKKLCMYM
jgi:Predicted metal-dependent hydrolase